MATRIEFLHCKEDILEFVSFMYANDCYISHRNPHKCNVILSMELAANALCSDLFSPFGTYYIGKGSNRRLLDLVSCGRQGHPRNLGKWGRISGVITCEDKSNVEAYSAFKLIKAYFQRNYVYQRYNGNARMNCFFGPKYLRLDKEYSENPEPNGMCPGYLRIVCIPEQHNIVCELIEDVCSTKQAIHIISSEWNKYWKDPDLLEVRTEFLYDVSRMDFDKFARLAYTIAGNSKMTNMRNSRRYMSASADWPLNFLKKEKKRNMSFVIENPFSPRTHHAEM